MMYEIKHRISGRVLFSLECGSLKLCVEAAVEAGADLAGADLAGADLAGADLVRANLAGADLADANLAGADLADADLATHLGYPNGWAAFAWFKDGQVRVQVGCRNFTIAEGRAYWAKKNNRREVLAALDYAEKMAELRGWVK